MAILGRYDIVFTSIFTRIIIMFLLKKYPQIMGSCNTVVERTFGMSTRYLLPYERFWGAVLQL